MNGPTASLKTGWSTTPLLAMGMSVFGIIVSDLYRPAAPSFLQRTVRFVVEDAPFASILCAVGFMIAAYHRSYVAQRLRQQVPGAAPEALPLPLTVRRISSAIALAVFVTYLGVQFFAGIDFTLLPLMAASLLLVPHLADATGEIVWGVGLFLVFLSAIVLYIEVFPAPFGPPFPIFSGLSYAVLGILIERLIHASPVWPWILTASGIAVECLGLFSVVVSGSDLENFSLEDLPGTIRFISGAAHSGGVLNVLGNWGFCILLIPLCSLIAQSGVLRTVCFPINALGRCVVTAYVCHLIVVYSVLSPFFPHNNPGEFADRIPAGTHLGLIGMETLLLLLMVTVWVRFRRLGPIEELAQFLAVRSAARDPGH